MQFQPLIEPAKTVAFTGYRPDKIKKSDPNNSNLFPQLQTDLLNTVLSLAEQGYTTFLSGMAEGVDLMGARAVLLAKNQYPLIHLIGVIPFPKQAQKFTDYWKREYESIKRDADYQITINDSYSKWVYFRRNDFLISNSSVLVSYYDGREGGTKYTFDIAIMQNRKILNLCQTEKGMKTMKKLKNNQI